jgi:ParB family chromosome partitioning protein
VCSAERKGLPVKVKMRHDQHFVEELASGQEPVGRMIPVRAITPNPDQPRMAMGDLSELVQSINDKGVLEPILVRGLAQDEAAPRGVEFLIISGERRFQAARRVGLAEIPAIIMDVNQDEALEIALVENLQRKDLTPFEEADGYRALREIHGYTHDQVAQAVGKSRTLVTEALGLLKLPRAVRSAAEALGIESKSTLHEVARLGVSPPEQIALLERVAGEGLNRSDLREEARRRRSGSRRRGAGGPPVFTFKDPEKTFSLSVRFRKKTVEREDLIAALERILEELKTDESSES